MRPLTKSEKKLLIIFLTAIFLIGNLFGMSFLFHKQESLQARLLTLQNGQREAKSWLAEKETWRKREAWLKNKQPKLQSPGEASAALLESLQTSARSQSITILEQSFAESDPQPAYQEIVVNLKVSGALESLTRWLVELQQPAYFQALPAFSMKSDTDPSRVVCELTVARWYAPAR